MSASGNAWTLTGERPPAQAWVDFGNFICATYAFPDDASDDDWAKLIKWADILMRRYNNRVLNLAVRGHLDLLSYRSTDKERSDWRAHRGNDNEASGNPSIHPR